MLTATAYRYEQAGQRNGGLSWLPIVSFVAESAHHIHYSVGHSSPAVTH
jgi:hypothetical protein